MRAAGRIRTGHFPLPLSEPQRIRRLLSVPGLPCSAIDPWVGDGGAVTNGTEALPYGIVLDAHRPEQARQRIPNVVQGNMAEVPCPVECLHLLYLNRLGAFNRDFLLGLPVAVQYAPCRLFLSLRGPQH